jgi:hypothetical protein
MAQRVDVVHVPELSRKPGDGSRDYQKLIKERAETARRARAGALHGALRAVIAPLSGIRTP